MTLPDQSEPPVLGTHRGFEVYPMPMFAAMETADVNALVQWYQAALGFAVMFRTPVAGEPVLVHLRRRKYQDVLVGPARAGRAPEPGGWTLCLQAGEDVDQLATHAAAVPVTGKAQVEHPEDTPWNTRQLRIVDPDGRVVVLSQPRFDPELTERIRRNLAADTEASG
jgi:hypothetical protein